MSIPSRIYLLSSRTSCWQQCDETLSAHLSACKHMSRSRTSYQPIHEAGSVRHFPATRPNHGLSVGRNISTLFSMYPSIARTLCGKNHETGWAHHFASLRQDHVLPAGENTMEYHKHTFLHLYNQITYNLSEWTGGDTVSIPPCIYPVQLHTSYGRKYEETWSAHIYVSM